ncbi:hypothetical protein [Streptomyces griseosporeus]|uniref:hypothetical protein n=1 Tax=Streptomyces griseosporeus TaxID=1910 RepID=UPI0036F9FC52
MTDKALGRVGGGPDIQAVGLDEIAKGITLVLDELKEIGAFGSAGAGRGFSELALTGLELGHEGVLSAFTSFCERWEWGVRALVVEGNNFADGVGLSAGTFFQLDQYVEGSFKVGANSLIGNPHATEDEITGKSWSQLAQDASYAYTHPDYSQESFQEAWANSKQGWNDAARDVMTSGPFNPTMPISPQQATGLSDSQYEQFLDATFGPSAEERAASAQQQAEPAEQGGETG